MKTSVALSIALLVSGVSQARPLIIEESQRLEAPDPALSFFADSVAIDGDWALATALRSEDGSFNYPYQQLALLYHRSGGVWRFDRVIVDDETDEQSWNEPSVAMKNGIAVVSTSPLRTFRLSGGNWTATPAPFPADAGEAAWANGLTRISGNTLVATAGRCNYGAITADRIGNGSTWSAPQSVTGNARICSIANYANSLDVDGNTLAMSNPPEDENWPPPALRLYSREGTGAPWQQTASLPAGDWGRGIALRGDELFVGSWSPYGTEIYRRNGANWVAAGHLPTPNGFAPNYDGAYFIARNAEFVLQSAGMTGDLRGAIAVYRRNGEGYERVALLAASNGDSLGPVIDISGRTVVVSGTGDSFDQGRLYFFELPESFANSPVLQDDFEDGNAAGWQINGGEFAVTRRGVTRVWRQSDLTGLGAAVLASSLGDTQSLTADIRPTTFAGNDRWVGLATRYVDAQNYYYVTLRSSGSVQLRRMRDGDFVMLASQSLPVAVNGNYRVRLESVGSRHRVYVNDVRLLEAFDGALDRGRAALLTYRTAADFDNVMITPGVRTTVYDSDIVNGSECRALVSEPELRVTGSPQWDCTVYTAPYLRQTSNAGAVRAALGPDVDDQVVESRVLVESFAGAGTDEWLGVVTRYGDARNFYFLALRSADELVLGRVVDGVVTSLDSEDYGVAPRAWYALRLEAVGDKLRGYVNGVLRVEATDTSHASGLSGIATERTAARFDYFRVHQP